jgi:hypothetical protein
MAQYSVNRQTHFNTSNSDLHEVVMLADQDGNLINTFGAASNVIISAGQLEGYSGVHKFGAVYGTSGSTMHTVWTAADTAGTALYDWTYSAGIVTVVSSSGSDVTDVTVQGLDENYNFVEETFTLTGATPTAAGSVTFARVNRAFMHTATNVGKVQVKRGSTVVTEIGAGFGQTLQSIYTVPAGKTAYLMNLSASTSKNQVTDLFLFQRPFGGAFRVQTTISLNQSNQTLEFPVPLKLTEKTDVDLRVQGSNNATVSVDFTMILVDND